MRIFFCLVALLPVFLNAATLKNEDVLKLHSAGLSDEVIITAIQNSECTFETSATAIIELNTAGISGEVIQAMLSPDGSESQDSDKTPAKKVLRPDVVQITAEGETQSMRYVIPTTRTKARGLGFGGIATYMVMRGTDSSLNISDRKPEFIVSVPENAQPESYVDVASFAVRKNGTREVLVAGGYASYSTGIHPDRRMPFTATRLDDQSKATEGFILYKMEPSRALEPGSYAVVFYNAEIAVPGFFGSGSNSCFDFTIQ